MLWICWELPLLPFSLFFFGSTPSHLSGFSLDVSFPLQEALLAMTQTQWDSRTSPCFQSIPLTFRVIYCIVTIIYFCSKLDLRLLACRRWTIVSCSLRTWQSALVLSWSSVSIHGMNEWSREWMNERKNEASVPVYRSSVVCVDWVCVKTHKQYNCTTELQVAKSKANELKTLASIPKLKENETEGCAFFLCFVGNEYFSTLFLQHFPKSIENAPRNCTVPWKKKKVFAKWFALHHLASSLRLDK